MGHTAQGGRRTAKHRSGVHCPRRAEGAGRDRSLWSLCRLEMPKVGLRAMTCTGVDICQMHLGPSLLGGWVRGAV